VEIVLLIAGPAFFLCWIGSLLARIATDLEACVNRSLIARASPAAAGAPTGPLAAWGR
jgi:hypothetical protein